MITRFFKALSDLLTGQEELRNRELLRLKNEQLEAENAELRRVSSRVACLEGDLETERKLREKLQRSSLGEDTGPKLYISYGRDTSEAPTHYTVQLGNNRVQHLYGQYQFLVRLAAYLQEIPDLRVVVNKAYTKDGYDFRVGTRIARSDLLRL